LYSIISQALLTERSLIESSLAAKTYVDTQNNSLRTYFDGKHVKNSVGFIPDLTSNQKNKSGFIVSASVTQENHHPWHGFNSRKADWCFSTSNVKEERWIKIKCPESIRIYKFTIRGREGNNVGKITDWILQSNDDNIWNDLYKGDKVFIDYEFKTFQVSSNTKYIYYRFIILEIAGDNLGLNHLQLYTIEPNV